MVFTRRDGKINGRLNSKASKRACVCNHVLHRTVREKTWQLLPCPVLRAISGKVRTRDETAQREKDLRKDICNHVKDIGFAESWPEAQVHTTERASASATRE